MTTFPERIGITDAPATDTARPGDDAGRALTVGEELVNVNGGLHGGVISTMLDATMGDAVRAGLEEGQGTVTVTMTVTFLTGAKEGDELRSSAEVRKRGGTRSSSSRATSPGSPTTRPSPTASAPSPSSTNPTIEPGPAEVAAEEAVSWSPRRPPGHILGCDHDCVLGEGNVRVRPDVVRGECPRLVGRRQEA